MSEKIFGSSRQLLLLIFLVLLGCSDSSDGISAPGEPSGPVEDACKLSEDAIEILSSNTGIEFVRTPDACFEELENYPFSPNYADVDGMRLHYVDEGPADGEVILMLHGQPSWSYLYRKMIPVLADAGYRVIAADHIGMGRSDKPVDPRVHTYEQQVAWNKAFIEALGLSNITLFVQDWGSLIGLRIAGDDPAKFARIVLANGDLPAIPEGVNPFTVPVFEIDETQPEAIGFFAGRSPDRVDGFQQWIEYAASTPHLIAGDVVQIGSFTERTPAEIDAYNAPFPSQIYRGAIRAFPSMIAGIQGQTLPAVAALGRFERPFLALAGEFDPNLGSEATQNRWIAHVPGSVGQDHRRYEAGHFIQEDVGAEMAAQVVEFMQSTPVPEAGPFYNLRYCEILLIDLNGDTAQAQVFNTLGLNDCPQASWDALDAEALTEEFEVSAAGKNGPRFWVLDRVAPNPDGAEVPPIPGLGDVETFGDIEMRLMAVVEIAGGSATEAEPYSINRVQRSTLFDFVVGRRIYELHDPQGGRYVMQSMSRIVDANLQLHDLNKLDERLSLPDGWRFSTRILLEPLQLVADGIAEVITDDLSNTYQKAE